MLCMIWHVIVCSHPTTAVIVNSVVKLKSWHVWDLKFSQWWPWRLLSSGMWLCSLVSEGCAASNFGIEEDLMVQAVCFSETLVPNCTVSHPTRQVTFRQQVRLHDWKASINQIVVQHNYLLNKFMTLVEVTCFGSFQWAIRRPYTVS
jgi:hypothetical protein